MEKVPQPKILAPAALDFIKVCAFGGHEMVFGKLDMACFLLEHRICLCIVSLFSTVTKLEKHR